MFAEEFLAPFLTLFREHDRFGLAHRIQDQPFRVQTIHGLPIVTFPCPSAVMECQEEKREYHLVDFVFVIIHEKRLPFIRPRCNRGGKVKVTDKLLEAARD
jgi:hypothetical protein